MVYCYQGERSAFASNRRWMTCQRLEGHSLSLSFQLLFTTQPWALLNNRKNVIWLLFKARRYHSLWPTMAANRTRGLGGYKGPHSKRHSLSSILDAHHPHTEAWRSGATDDKPRRVMAKCRALTAHLSSSLSSACISHPAQLEAPRPSDTFSALTFGEDKCMIPYTRSFRLFCLFKDYIKQRKKLFINNCTQLLSWQENKKLGFKKPQIHDFIVSLLHGRIEDSCSTTWKKYDNTTTNLEHSWNSGKQK